ncbi:AMP-binding enzyme [Saccharopolyspora montiporae]|uniref:AMP-binding enzyme n=1 Tax=Saccharopolyspora montiporae TaxID=2781240 RepID=UPI001D13C792
MQRRDRARARTGLRGQLRDDRHVEEAINQHPAVLECAVAGVPDEQWGMTPARVAGIELVSGPDTASGLECADDVGSTQDFCSPSHPGHVVIGVAGCGSRRLLCGVVECRRPRSAQRREASVPTRIGTVFGGSTCFSGSRRTPPRPRVPAGAKPVRNCSAPGFPCGSRSVRLTCTD